MSAFLFDHSNKVATFLFLLDNDNNNNNNNNNYKTSIAPISSQRIELRGAPSKGGGVDLIVRWVRRNVINSKPISKS